MILALGYNSKFTKSGTAPFNPGGRSRAELERDIDKLPLLLASWRKELVCGS